MHTGVESGGKTAVARDSERDAALPTEFGDRAAEGGAVGCRIVPVNNAADMPRQAGDGGKRIGQHRLIGEQP